jgi:hypothetical protein
MNIKNYQLDGHPLYLVSTPFLLSFSAGLYHLSLPLRAVFLAAIMEKVQEGSEDKTEIVEPPLGWGYK